MKNYILTFLLAVLVVLTGLTLRQSVAGTGTLGAAQPITVAFGGAPVPIPPPFGGAPVPIPPEFGGAPVPIPPPR